MILTVSSLYTFTVYMGFSIYVAGEDEVMHDFGVRATPAAHGLALYVVGCTPSVLHIFRRMINRKWQMEWGQCCGPR